MVTMIGYGPEANFAEAPKAPKWVTKVRYKTTASLMRGMGGMMGGYQEGAAPPPSRRAWSCGTSRALPPASAKPSGADGTESLASAC